MFDVRGLSLPILTSPMAGGTSAPSLVAAVARAGGLGMLPGGSISAEALGASVSATRELLARAGGPALPFGVNLFVPRSANTAEAPIADVAAHARGVGAFRAALASLLDLDVSDLGIPVSDHDEDWRAKLDLIERERVPFVTFTFGLPKAQVIERLHRSGIATGVMVTNDRDAYTALDAGIDVLIAQGAEAGGHRSTWRVSERPNTNDTVTVVAAIREAVQHRQGRAPVIVAAGGIDGPKRVAAVRQAGASHVQVGTAVLLADEAGTKPTVRLALTDDALTETMLTRAFSGRAARALRNRLADLLDPIAPAAYPDVNQITGPVRAAAERRGDIHGVSAYAGVHWRSAKPAPVAAILREILGE